MDKKELLDILNKNIEESIDVVFEPQNMLSFIETFKHFYFYDYKNLLLLWLQVPTAKMVAGISAIKKLNLQLNSDTPKVALLYPVFTIKKSGNEENEFQSGYDVIFAYDISSIPEYKEIKSENHDIMSKIKRITGCTINEASNDNITRSSPGIYDSKKNEIIVRKNLSDKKLIKTLIEVYVDISLGDGNSEFNLLEKSFVKYMVFSFFDIVTKEDNISTICTMYKGKEKQEKMDMLSQMCQDAADIIMDLSKHVLTFNQTAILNSLLTSDYYQIASRNLKNVASGIDDSYLSNEISILAELLSYTDDEYLKTVFELVEKKALFSYPPYELIFKN